VLLHGGRALRVAFRDLERVGTRDPTSFGAQWLAYTLPCGRFAVTRAGANARLGASTLFCQTQHRALPSLRKRALGAALDPVSGTASHRSYLCEIRPVA
jgi:hypothetical protein